jgi:hypothetical protein
MCFIVFRLVFHVKQQLSYARDACTLYTLSTHAGMA